MKKKIASILMALCSTFAITGLASCDLQEVLPDSGNIGNGSYTMELVDNGFNPLVAYGEAIDCTNLTLHYKQILNNKVIWDTTIPVSSQMFVSGGDTSTVGEKELVIAYETYQFTIDYEVKYRVEYSALDGVFDTQYVYDASEIVKKEAPVYEGYTFQYWKTEIPEVLTGNLTIDAQYYKDDLTAPTVETIVKTYALNMTLGDFTLPSNEAGKWEFVDDLSTAITSVGSYDYAIRYVPATPEQPSVEDRMVRIVINQKEITVTAGEGNFIYNGNQQIPTYTFSESGLPIQRTIVAEGSATPLNEVPTNVGTYKVYFTLDNANYTLLNNQFTYKIAPKEVAILSDVGTYVYNGQGQAPDYSVSEEGLNVIRNIYAEGTTTPLTELPVNAGKYTITYTLADANYRLLVSAEDCAYEIAPKEVTLKIGKKDFEYNGNKQFPSWTPSEEGLPIVKNVYVKGSNEPLAEDPINAGTYTYVFTLDDPNYLLVNTQGEYTITPKFAYIEYEITDFDYNGKHQFPTFTPSDPNMEVVTTILLNNQTPVTECINAGTYYYTLSVTDPNYECEPVEEESFTIYPKQVEITVSGTELTYNGQEQFPNVSAPEGVELVGILPQKNAGMYTYAISPKSANYAGSAEGKFTIAQKQITFTVAEGTTSFVYDGEAHKPTITMEGAVEGEIVNVLESVEAKTGVGEYNYSITVMDSNYVGSIKGSFEIKALQLRITMDDKNMFYGNKVPEFTYTIEETLDGVTYTAYTGNTDILEITPNSYDVPNVGSYPITVTLGNENVEADIIEGTLTVYTGQSDPADPKLSSDEEYTAPMYGDKLGDVTFSVGLGTWAWDNPDQIIDKMKGFKATATFTSQNPNLAPTTKEFTLKYVQKRQLNFVVEESGRVYTYDGEPHSIVYTITDSKIEGKVYEDISVVGEVTQTNAGEYRTTLQIVSDCYVGSQLVDLVIKKATPTPTFTTLDNVKWSAALRLSDISLPENFAWKADMDLDDVKTYECLAVYTHPEGTQNYEQVEGLFTFDVVRADNALNGVKEEYNFTFADKVFTLSGITATSGTTVLYQYTKDGESVDSLKDAGTYEVLVYVEQSDYYVYAETTTTVHIAKAKNNDTVNTTQNKTYGDMISSLALPTESSAIGTWSWKDAEGNSIENPTTTPVGNAGTVTLKAVFTPHTDHVKNYESREVTVTVNVGRKTIGEPTVGNLELTYTGEAQTVSVTPAEGTEGLYEVFGNVQTNAGTDYVIQLTLKEEHKDNYKWWTNQTDQTIAFKKFNIAKATNVVTVTQENWTYGQETTPAPEIEATFDADSKNFTFLYSSDGTNYDEQKPKNAGTYWIKAKIKVINSNYNTEESQPVEFEIYKADPTDANFTTQYTVTWQEGLTLSGISLPSGYAWKTPTTALVPGQDEYEATYTKSNNYNAKDGKFTVIVNKIETVISVNANRTFAYEESAFDTTNPTALQNWLGVSVNHTEGLNATYAFTYSGEMNPAPTTEIKYVGTYTLTITVAETAHYAEATKEVVITVNKKTNTQSINITTSYNKDLTLADLNDQFASKNEEGKGTWTWKDATQLVGEVTAVNTPRTFEVVFTPTDSVNYASREAIAYLTVNKATPTLSVSITGWDYLQYNGSVNSPVPNYGTVQNTDGVTVRYVYKQGNTELTLDEMKNAEVGTYTVTAILDASDNFTYKASEPFTFYITQQKVAVPEIKNATYTGAPLDVVVKDAYVNDVGLYTLAPETKTEAGTHDITVTLKNTKNYAWTDGTTESKTVTFTIEKAEVTATISLTDTMGDALTYTTNTKQVAVAFTLNSSATEPTYTTTVNDVVNGTILNAGFYAVTISLNDTDNYVLVAGGSKNFTIQQATNTWKVTPAMQDWTYGGTASAEVGEATFGNATLKVLYEGTNYTSYKSSNKPTNAGTYQVTYSVAETSNYSGLSETVEFTIAKADVETFTISISGWVYDPENKNAVAPTYTTSNTDANRVVTYTYAPVDEHGTVGTYTATVPSTVGAYSVKADMQTTANFNAKTSEPVEFAITKATPTLTVMLQGWTYSSDNANANAPSYETSNKEGATIAYLYTGTTNASVNYSSTEKPTQAGSYKVTATLGVTDNYTQAQAEANFTIAKATYTPNAPQITNEKVTYGDLLSSVILADNNNGYGHWAWVDTTEGLTVGNAGWRTFATKFVLDNTASYNYNAVPNQTAGFTVEKKTLQITAEGANSENVVTKIYNGFKQSISYTLKDGEETYTGLTVLGNTEYTTVGSYNITLTIYENNYVGQASFTLKIDKADLTDAEKTIEAKEAIYEDTLGMYALPTTDKGTWSWVDGNDTLVGGVGTKTFQAKFTGNGNYNDIEDVDVTFTVAPKTLYFEAQATQTYVYVAGQTYSLSYTLKDTAGKVYSSLNVIRDTKEQAGTYTNLSLALSETNYKAETLTGLTLIIKQADYTVTLPTDLRAIYDTLLKNVTLPTTEEGTWKWNEHETTTVGNVGNNTFSATFTPADINYASANYRLTVQVTKASVVIPSKPDSKTYTGNTLTANIVQHNLYSVFMNEGGTNVGKYSITYKLKTEFTVNYQWAELTDEQVKAGITVSGAYVTLPFEITKATPVINTNNWVNWTGWTYGQTSNMPNVTTNFGEIVYTYAPVVDSVVGEYTTTVPTEVGKYSVKASVSATSNWNVAVDVTKDFAISQATNAITSLTITGWTYGQNANAPTVVATFGGDTAQYTYALVVNNEVVGEYTTTVPTNAGTYRVKATIAETTNYESAETTQDFEIEKADNTIDQVTLAQNAVYGDLVNAKLTLPTSTIGAWTWKNVTETTTVGDVGTHTFYAVFTPNTINYKDKEVAVTVTVSQKEVELPNVPSKVYTGTALKADLEDTDLYTVTQADNMVNAGNHSITLTLEDATNYKWATTENLSGDNNKTLTLTFTITKAEAKISYVDVGNWSYGDAPKALEITANITVDSNYLDYKYYDEEGNAVSSITNTTPAGMYKVVVKIKASDNYTESVPYNTWIIISQAKVNVPQIGYVTHIVNTTEAQTADVPSSTLYSVIENEGGTEIDRYYVVLKLNDYNNYKWNIPDGYDREMNEEVVIELNRVTISYEIVPTQNTWMDAPTLNGVTWTQNGTNTTEWTFGDVVTVNTPKAEYPKATEDVNSGNYNLRITYIGREGTQYAESTDMPKNVGKYTATFFVPAKEGEWSALRSTIDFEIKAQDVTPVLHLDGSATNSVTYKNGDFAVSTIISGKNANGANYTLEENVDYKLTVTKNNAGAVANVVGNYLVIVTLLNTNYNLTEDKFSFEIIQDTPTLSIKTENWTGWNFHAFVAPPYTTSNTDNLDGKVTYTYSTEENGTYTEDRPTNVGTYYVKVTIAETTNYETKTSDPVEFNIRPINNTIDQVITARTATYKDLISDYKITATASTIGAWKWQYKDTEGNYCDVDATTTVGGAGTQTFYAVFICDTNDSGTKNYNDYKDDTAIAVTFTVDKFMLYVPELITKTYTGSGLEAEVKPFENASEHNPDPSLYGVEEGTWTNAGTHKVSLTLQDPNNYKWNTSVEATVQVDFVIEKQGLSKPSLQTKTYTGEALTAEVIEGTTNTDLYEIKQEGWINAGTHQVTLTLTEEAYKNFEWEDSTTKELKVDFIVNKATTEDTISWSEGGWIYKTTDSITTPEATWSLKPTIADLIEQGTFAYIYTDTNGVGVTINNELAHGTYTVTLTIADTNNYYGTTTSKTFTVTQATVTVKLADNSLPYDGNDQSVVPVLTTNNGHTLTLGTDYTITGETAQTVSDTYAATLTLTNANYVWALAEGTSGSITGATASLNYAITQVKNGWKTNKEPSITEKWIYGATPTVYKGESTFGETPSVAYYNYDANAEHNLGDSATHLDTNGIPTYVGKYVAVFTTETDGTNYTSVSGYIEFEITQATVVATYSGTTTFTYENKDHTVDVKVTDTSNNNVALTSGYTLTDNTKKDADTYKVKVELTGDTAQNYMFAGDTDTFTFTTGWTIDKATATASLSVTDTIDGKAFTYTGNDGKTVTATASVLSTDYVDTLAYTTGIPTIMNAGSYEVTLTLTDATNHKWAELTGLDSHVTYTINGATLTYTVVIDEEIATLPTLNTYNNGKVEYDKVDGKDVIHVPVTDSQDKTLYTVTVNRPEGVDSDSMPVGVYTVVVSLNDKANYNWSALTAAGWTYNATEETFTYTYNVVAKKLTAPTYTVDKTTYNGAPVTITFGACEASYNVSIKDSHGNTFSATDVTDAETYTITLTLKDDNYLWNNGSDTITLTQTFTIAPTDANVDLTVNGQQYNSNSTFDYKNDTYDYALTVNGVSGALTNGADKDYTYTITYTNVAGTETGTATEITKAGTYVITLTMSNSNYEAITETYTITIKPIEVSHTITNKGTYTYNGSVQTPTIEVTPTADYTSVITQTADGSADSSFAGSYSIAWNLNDTNNYTWKDSTPTETYTINPAKVTPVVKVNSTQIAKTGNSFVYTSGEYTVTVTIEDLTVGTDFTVDQADTIKGVDSYDVKITLRGDAAINYTFTEDEKDTEETYTFSITPAEVKAEFTLTDDTLTDDNGDAYTYTDYNKTVTATASVTSNGYVSTLEYTTSIPNDIKNATEYTVTYTLTDAVNHKWSTYPKADRVKILSATVNGATLTVTFKVAQATNAWTTENILSVTNWTYAPDTVHKPMAYAKFGEVKIYFSTTNTTEQSAYTEWTDSAHPVNADTYYIIAVVEGNQNFNGLTTINNPVSLTIGSDELAEPTLGKYNNDTVEYTENAQFPVDLNEIAGGKYAVKVEYKATAEGSYAELADKTKTNVGYYKITLTLDNPVGVANYAWPTTLTNGWGKDGANANVIYYEYEITKATIEQPTLTFKDVSGNEIDATYYGGTFTVCGFDTAKYSYAISPETVQDAGEYTVTLTMNDVISTNYKWWNGTGIFKFTITKATNGWTNGNEPSVNGGTNVWDYTGAVVEITKGVANCGSTATVNYVGREGTTYEESTAQPTNAGKYTAIFNVGESTNYGAIETTIDFEIKVKVINIPTLAPVEGAGPTTTEGSNHYIYKWIAKKTYTVWTITNPVEYTVAGDTASFDTDASYEKEEGKITLTLKNPQDQDGKPTAINYKWNGADTQTVTITYLVEHKVYVPVPTIYLNGAGSNESTRPSGTFEYNNKKYVLSVAPSPQYTWTFKRNEETDNYTDTTKATPVGTYTLTVRLNEDHYVWETVATEKGWRDTNGLLTYTFTITQANNSWATNPTLAGTFASGQNGTASNPFTWEYKSTTPTITNGVDAFGGTATYSIEGRDGTTYGPTTTLHNDKVGKYKITFTVSADTNGNYTGLSTIIYFEITPKEIRFEAKEGWTLISDVYTRTYNGKDLEFAETSFDYKLVDKDGKDLTTNSHDAKSYTVYAQLLDENYVWSSTKASTKLVVSYRVAPAQIYIKHNFNTLYYQNEWLDAWNAVKDNLPTENVYAYTKDDNGNVLETSVAGTLTASIDEDAFTAEGGKVIFTFDPDGNNDNNYIAGEIASEYYNKAITIKSVAYYNSKYYGTIEYALGKATSGTVIVIPDTTGRVVITKPTEISSGVTLNIPYAATESNGVLQATANSATASDDMYETSITTAKCLSNIILAENITIINKGKIEIGGILSGGSGSGAYAGQTVTSYAQLSMRQGAKIESTGTLNVYGYIRETSLNNKSEIILNDGTLYMPFILRDYRGGTSMNAIYNAISEYHISAFNQIELLNVESRLTIHYNANLTGWANLNTSLGNNMTYIYLVGNKEDNANGNPYLIEFTDTDHSYLTAKYDKTTQICDLDIYGGANTNSMTLDVKVLVTIHVSTDDVYFPLSWRFDISLNKTEGQQSANYNMNQRFKLMPGAVFTVNEGAKLTIEELIVYSEFDDSLFYSSGVSGKPYYNTQFNRSTQPAEFYVNGTVTATNFAGTAMTTNSTGRLTITGSNTITSHEAKAQEGEMFLSRLTDTEDIEKTANGMIYNRDTESATNGDLSAGRTYYAIPTNNPNEYAWFDSSTDITVEFDVSHTNATVETTSKTVHYGSGYGTLPTPTNTGYVFGGWYLTPACDGERIYNITIVDSIENHTLYALWVEIDPIKVNFYVDDELVYTDSETYVPGFKYGSFTANPQKIGYKVEGWYSDSACTQKVSTDDIVPNTTVNLYVKWTKKTFIVKIVDNASASEITQTISVSDGATVEYGSTINIRVKIEEPTWGSLTGTLTVKHNGTQVYSESKKSTTNWFGDDSKTITFNYYIFNGQTGYSDVDGSIIEIIIS